MPCLRCPAIARGASGSLTCVKSASNPSISCTATVAWAFWDDDRAVHIALDRDRSEALERVELNSAAYLSRSYFRASEFKARRAVRQMRIRGAAPHDQRMQGKGVDLI